MPIKKSELYSSLWQGCDELRGGMDASQYKDYVLVLLFVKYVSDKYAGQQDALLEVPESGSFADIDDKDRKTKEKPDFLIGKRKYKAELIPVDLMIKRFFAQEQAAIAQSIEELKEEHSGEDGLLSEVLDEGKISKGAMSARLKAIKGDRDAGDERQVLTEYLALLDKETEANKQVKEAQKQLLETVAAKYGVLTLAEIQSLVVDDKWLAHLAAAVQSEMDRVSQALAGRIKTLGDRYGVTLPQLVDEVAARVEAHLQRMGASYGS